MGERHRGLCGVGCLAEGSSFAGDASASVGLLLLRARLLAAPAAVGASFGDVRFGFAHTVALLHIFVTHRRC